MHNNISLSKRRREKEYLYMHSVQHRVKSTWKKNETKNDPKAMVEHTQNRTYKAKFENKAKDFCASAAVVFVVVLFISWIGTKRNKKKELKTRKNTSPDLFLLSLVDLHASRPVQFAQYSNAILDIVQIYRYRYWYSCSFCIWQFQLRQCFCFALLCVRSFLLFELNSPWLDFCVQTDGPTDGTERATINFKS